MKSIILLQNHVIRLKNLLPHILISWVDLWIPAVLSTEQSIYHPDLTTVIECCPKLQSASVSCDAKQESWQGLITKLAYFLQYHAVLETHSNGVCVLHRVNNDSRKMEIFIGNFLPHFCGFTVQAEQTLPTSP